MKRLHYCKVRSVERYFAIISYNVQILRICKYCKYGFETINWIVNKIDIFYIQIGDKDTLQPCSYIHLNFNQAKKENFVKTFSLEVRVGKF